MVRFLYKASKDMECTVAVVLTMLLMLLLCFLIKCWMNCPFKTKLIRNYMIKVDVSALYF